MSEKDIESLKKDVHKILNYLHNDEGTGEKGLVAQVHILQDKFTKFVVKYETDQAIKRAKMGVIGVVGGVIGTVLLWVAEKIVEHIKP